jgi:hypothetical protein
MVPAAMVSRKCPTRMVMFVPVDTDLRKVIVFLEHPHNHPAFPISKPSAQAKAILDDAISATRIQGLTVGKLVHGGLIPSDSYRSSFQFGYIAPSTIRICNGQALSVAAPGFNDSRRVRTAIHKAKTKNRPEGQDWMGEVLFNE